MSEQHDGPEPMTRESLDQLVRSGMNMLAISPVCHTGAPVFVVYGVEDGCLGFVCAICRQFACKVQVATTTGPCSEEVH